MRTGRSRAASVTTFRRRPRRPSRARSWTSTPTSVAAARVERANGDDRRLSRTSGFCGIGQSTGCKAFLRRLTIRRMRRALRFGLARLIFGAAAIGVLGTLLYLTATVPPEPSLDVLTLDRAQLVVG